MQKKTLTMDCPWTYDQCSAVPLQDLSDMKEARWWRQQIHSTATQTTQPTSAERPAHQDVQQSKAQRPARTAVRPAEGAAAHAVERPAEVLQRHAAAGRRRQEVRVQPRPRAPLRRHLRRAEPTGARWRAGRGEVACAILLPPMSCRQGAGRAAQLAPQRRRAERNAIYSVNMAPRNQGN